MTYLNSLFHTLLVRNNTVIWGSLVLLINGKNRPLRRLFLMSIVIVYITIIVYAYLSM
jgi:hypothetical protein